MQKFIHSVKLHISHQMKPCSSVKVICLVKLYLFLCICGIGTSQLNQTQITQIMDSMQYTENHQKCQMEHSHQMMMPYSSVKAIYGAKLYLFQYIWGIGANWGDWAQIPPIIGTNTQKVIHSVKLHISHQMKPYLSVNAI